MSWTDERIDTLKKMWDKGLTATQIAEELGGVSRNAVIGKAHRLGLQSRPSPVKQNEAKAAAALVALTAAAAATPEPAPVPEEAAPPAPPPAPKPAPAPAPVVEAEPAPQDAPVAAAPAPALGPRPASDGPVLRSVGPGGFVRQNPGDQAPPSTPAPPRRLVPAKPSEAIAGKTSLLDLNDRICKWPLGHPGEPDFHFCGDKVNPGFPYCVAHCGHAYQAQLPRRDRRPAPPLPFGGAARR
ncbi:GcrA family cell cycle regulator [Sphingomonas xinjiangensis]|uniref:GcrA cell cycle regulator n=1 Tax=Sphingomonas xinjiangensis TaxID=643568 RepID=A0A840YCW6_9SPHN|nr:GcrA family cell cycle regulator [Sphingomonas xinjiangensis]MBB5710135.1 GcrA cell cycle regulator [Sphingomonas xinjiangensis]